MKGCHLQLLAGHPGHHPHDSGHVRPREQKDATEYSEILGYSTEDGVSKGMSRAPGSLPDSRSSGANVRCLAANSIKGAPGFDHS